MLVGLMHNSTTEKETKNGPVHALKKSVNVSFGNSRIEKIEKKIDEFRFSLPFNLGFAHT